MRFAYDKEYYYYWDETQIVVIRRGNHAPDARIMARYCSCGQPAMYTLQSGWYIDNYTNFPLYEPYCEECLVALLEE